MFRRPQTAFKRDGSSGVSADSNLRHDRVPSNVFVVASGTHLLCCTDVVEEGLDLVSAAVVLESSQQEDEARRRCLRVVRGGCGPHSLYRKEF